MGSILAVFFARKIWNLRMHAKLISENVRVIGLKEITGALWITGIDGIRKKEHKILHTNCGVMLKMQF